MDSQEPESADAFETSPWGDGSPEGVNEPLGKRADRNLLLGLLAFQNGFIEHDTLVDAVHSWIADKDKPLGSILQGWGIVDEDQVEVLGRLVIQHLKKHQGSGVRSLSTIEATASLRRELGTVDDDAVETVLCLATTKKTARETPRAGGRFDGRTRSRYLKSSLVAHARGGLGEVFIADDLELRRKVALKEIRSQNAHDVQSRARFLLEGEVTGNLEHPGIVPVYGLGLYEDGRPYYAMRFVRGQNLKETINQFREEHAKTSGDRFNHLGFRGLLRRFIDVCNAIEYAHSRKVLHRDLKPANIMLGKFGETLVVDWGLAKLMDLKSGEVMEPETDPGEGPLHPSASSEVDPTQMAQPIGTPQYMSPEQAACRVDLLSPLSDVCGLGATLYYMLTGQSPYPDGDRDKVIKGDFPRPREIDSQVPRALEAICLKAMATVRENRYPSALAFAEDIDRWLGDLPVTAYRDPPTVRLARWGKRHRTLVVGAAVLLISSVIGLAMTNVIVSREKTRTELARRNAEDALTMTGDVIRKLMVDVVADRLAEIPHTSRVRRSIADESIGLARRFTTRWPDDPLVAVVAAPTFHLSANLYRSLGESDRSFDSYRDAIQLYDRAISFRPTGREISIADSIRGVLDYAESLRVGGRVEEAIRQFDEARRRVELMKRETPEDPDVGKLLARCCYNKANLLVRIGRLDEARSLFDEAIPLLESNRARAPSNSDVRLILTFPLLGKAMVARDQGRLEEAGPAFERSLENLKTLPATNNVEYLRARTLEERGRWLALIPGRGIEAKQSYDESVRILAELVEKFDELPQYRLHLAIGKVARGLVMTDLAGPRNEEARKDGLEAREILELLIKQNLRVGESRSWLGEALGLLGRLEPDRESGIKLLKTAIETQKEAIQNDQNGLHDQEALRRHERWLEALESARPFKAR